MSKSQGIARELRGASPPRGAGRGGGAAFAIWWKLVEARDSGSVKLTSPHPLPLPAKRGGERRAVWSAGFMLLALTAFSPALAADAPPPSAWREISWPFLRDAWPSGRAFVCSAADCGVETILTSRVKVGFCDCGQGVADDDEVDRVGDVDLVNRNFAPLAKGDPVKISGMYGRKRLYTTKESKPRRVMVFAGGRNCNAFVAMAISAADFPPRALEAAEALLDEPAFMRWVVEKEGGG